MAVVLIVEDEQAVRRALSGVLSRAFPDYSFLEAENGSQALDVISSPQELSLVLCDIKMPAPDGVEVLSRARDMRPELPFVMLSGHGDIDTAVDCLKKGAFDYLQKPPDLNRLVSAVRDAVARYEHFRETAASHAEVTEKERTSCGTENDSVAKGVSMDFAGKFGMIGSSEELVRMQAMIERVAPTEAKVLVEGENGTGKELVVKAIHGLSQRSGGPLVEVNCAAIPSDLIESELFGHEKGAFTTALRQHKGKFEQADGGTLFLDEVGDMSLPAQAKVLRAIQEGRITRVGGDREISVNVRIVAATNKDIKKLIGEGLFREDLYHRLSVVGITVPPLRQRRGDIPSLASFFLKKALSDNNLPEKSFLPDAVEVLCSGVWSGNVRELQNPRPSLRNLRKSVRWPVKHPPGPTVPAVFRTVLPRTPRLLSGCFPVKGAVCRG